MQADILTWFLTAIAFPAKQVAERCSWLRLPYTVAGPSGILTRFPFDSFGNETCIFRLWNSAPIIWALMFFVKRKNGKFFRKKPLTKERFTVILQIKFKTVASVGAVGACSCGRGNNVRIIDGPTTVWWCWWIQNATEWLGRRISSVKSSSQEACRRRSFQKDDGKIPHDFVTGFFCCSVQFGRYEKCREQWRKNYSEWTQNRWSAQ